MKLGVYDFYNRSRFTAAIEAVGGEVVWSRHYYTTQSAAQMGQVATDAALGWKVCFSFKGATGSANDWANIAAGSEDTRWTAIGNMLAAIPNGGSWIFHHEPENDPPQGQYGSSTYGDQFRAAFDRIAGIIKPLAPHWQACANLFDEVFPSWEFGTRGGNWVASPDPNRWIPSSIDILGVDYYAFRGASDAGSHWATTSRVYDFSTAINDFLSYATARGVPLCFPEFGYLVQDPAINPGDEANRTAWLEAVAAEFATNPNIQSCMWFEVSEHDQADKSNHSITDPTQPPTNAATVAAFASFDSTGTVTAPNGVLEELPITGPRFWDTAWASTGNGRHEGRPQAVVKKGDWIYVGGNFNRVDDMAGGGGTFNRFNLCRYSATTGQLDTVWNPSLNGQVRWMTLSADETKLYVVGNFTLVGTTTRNYIAAFDTATGNLNTGYFSGFACNNFINSIVIDGTTAYVGGYFTSIGGSTRNRAAKLDVTSSIVTVDASWNPNVSQPVENIKVAIDGGTHKVALNIDPQGSVGGVGVYSVAMVNSTTGALLWGQNSNAGGGYVMDVNDDHNGGQVYFGSRGTEGNRLYCYNYSGTEQWWFRGNGDVQGVGFWRGLVVAAKHDSMVAAVKNSSNYTEVGGGVFIVNKDGVLQPAPWRSQFLQGDSTNHGVLRCFGAFGILEADFGCLIMTGEFGAVQNFAGTQTKSPAPWRLAQFNEGGTTAVPGSHGWDIGYWDADYWGSLAGLTQDSTVVAPAGAFGFAGAAPVVTITPNAADALVTAPAGAFGFTAALPDVTAEQIGVVDVTAPAGQFSFAGQQASVQNEIYVNVIAPAGQFRFAGATGIAVDTDNVTIVLRRPKRFKSWDKTVQQGQVDR